MGDKPHIMIVEARFYEDIADMLLQGTTGALDLAGATYETFTVPGALEIPVVVKAGFESGKFDGYIGLGCVIRGETSHYDVVAGESARGLMDLSVGDSLAIGNGILTCDTKDQAVARAHPEQKNKGKDVSDAVLSVLSIKGQLAK